MGIKGLYSYLKHYRTDIDLRTRTGPPLRIGVDAMSILYRYRGNTAAIMGLMGLLGTAGHRLFFVFDGKPPVEKEREVNNRREAKGEAAVAATAIQEFLATPAAAGMTERDRAVLEQSLARNKAESWHMTRDTRRAFQNSLWEADIPYVKGLSEADDVLADMVAAGKLDCILSTDMDSLLSGVGRLWIPSRKGDALIEEIVLGEVLEGEGFELVAFRDACLLCGTEEREGMRGVPAHTAFAWIRHYGSLEGVAASSVADRTFRQMFPGPEVIAAARMRLESHGLTERMRPDHVERVKGFLGSL